MKRTFLILCVVLCFITFVLYSRTTVNWSVVPRILSNTLLLPLYPSGNASQFINLGGTDPQAKPVTRRPARNPPLPPSENRRFAIFACSIHASTLAYSFYTPITTSSWHRVGYEAIVVFVGDFKKPNVLTARLNLSRNYLKRVGAHIVDVQCNESYSVKLSQLVRVFSGFLPDHIVQDDDNILTGDSDLMPLKESEYKPTAKTDGFLFNAFCCGSFQRRGRSYRMFPSKTTGVPLE